MKFCSAFLQLGLASIAVLPAVLAGGCCKFTLSSTGSFACPAGQLPDGQIRLNGSEPISTFCIDSKGGITDGRGYGCIVTEAPITQVQCNANTAPDDSFFIDSSGTLKYKGSSSFYACPATDTEYNVYVAPNFGQAKCFPITLQASGCGAQASSSTCAASTVTSTITQVQTVTGNAPTVTATETETETQTDSKTLTQTVISTTGLTSWMTTTETLSCTTSWSTSSSSTSSYSITIPPCRICNKTMTTSMASQSQAIG
ncbi:hypothetical protein F5Y04DRAFT_276732 [Hypomontagnella monticulosa]|nr:hypothetical protein F5Y04DRAFT_276732 [Hypomontagnella monticulosa]